MVKTVVEYSEAVRSEIIKLLLDLLLLCKIGFLLM